VNVVNPADGQVIDRVREDTPSSITHKLAAARAAQPAWAARPVAERVRIVERFRQWIVDGGEGLATTLTDETGKPITQSRNEVQGLLGRLDFFTEVAETTLADEEVHRDDSIVEVVAHDPLGVVADVSAWNYPLFVSANVVVPALLAGNAVLYKPSELATVTGLAMASMLGDAGVPVDVLGVVAGGGDVGADLVRRELDGVFFTGSRATGLRIAEARASSLAPVQLELGGKDAVYVCDDVDVAAAAAAVADGAFYNNGQSCCAVERIYVHRDIHPAFVDALVGAVEAFVMGDPREERTYLGPLTRAEQVDLLEAQVASARAAGARVVTGGRRVAGRPGNWFEPTVLVDVDGDMAVMREESFGPIVGVEAVDDDDAAVASMDDTDYGLTAGVYSRDEDRARRVLGRLDTGSAYWNCCDRVSPRLPWSGRRGSGVGVTLSRAGILVFTRPRAWHLRRPG
jgi:acyl-CoA reductase-like NAD-dependent aldehyde dehydrogenase